MHLSRDMHQQITAYLLDEMDATTRRRFEQELAAQPMLAREVTIQADLIQGIREQAMLADVQQWYGRVEARRRWLRWGIGVGLVSMVLGWIALAPSPSEPATAISEPPPPQLERTERAASLPGPAQGADRTAAKAQPEPVSPSVAVASAPFSILPMIEPMPRLSDRPELLLATAAAKPQRQPVGLGAAERAQRRLARQREDRLIARFAAVQAAMQQQNYVEAARLIPTLRRTDVPQDSLQHWAASLQAHLLSGTTQLPARSWQLGHVGTRSPLIDNPPREVELDAFEADNGPVRVAAFCHFLNSQAARLPHVHPYFDLDSTQGRILLDADGFYYAPSATAHLPMVGVTGYGAAAFARWCGKQVATQAQLEAIGVFSHKHVSALTGYQQGVAEWCQDWYQVRYLFQAPVFVENPTGAGMGTEKLILGDPAVGGDHNVHRLNKLAPAETRSYLGFRCVAPLEGEP